MQIHSFLLKKYVRTYAAVTQRTLLSLCVVGTGPAGISTAKSLIKRFGPRIRIDFYDKLQYPGGLLRYGVAPDHPEIRHLIRDFDQLCSPSCGIKTRFFKGITVVNCPSSRTRIKSPEELLLKRYSSTSISLESLRQFYHVVVLATGQECPTRLGLPRSSLNGILTGSHFMKWCNGFSTPHRISETPPLVKRFLQQMTLIHGTTQRFHPFTPSDPHVVIIGFGNVALDVARIILKQPIPHLIPQHVKSFLSLMKASRVTILGRKPLDRNRFSPAQLRELLNLHSISTTRSDSCLHQEHPQCSRRSRKAIQLLRNLPITTNIAPLYRTNALHFMGNCVPLQYRSSNKNPSWVSHLDVLNTHDSKLIPIPTDLVVECIGYQPHSWFESPFCCQSSEPQPEMSLDSALHYYRKNNLAPVFRTGWCRLGSRGAVPETILDAMATAALIQKYLETGLEQNILHETV